MEKFKIDCVMLKLQTAEIGSCFSDFDLDLHELELTQVSDYIKDNNLADIQLRNSDEFKGICFLGFTEKGFEYLDKLNEIDI